MGPVDLALDVDLGWTEFSEDVVAIAQGAASRPFTGPSHMDATGE